MEIFEVKHHSFQRWETKIRGNSVGWLKFGVKVCLEDNGKFMGDVITVTR